MRKLIVYPSDPMQAYLDLGQTYEYFEDYFNPGGYFDEVYAISPWGERKVEKHGKITYIKEKPQKYRKLVEEITPDVVRAYGGYWCADWLALSRVKEIPTVVSVHDKNPDLIFDSIKYADNVVCMAQCVQDAVRKKVNCVHKGEWVMGNRIDIDLFTYNQDKTFNQELNKRFGFGRHILHVGRKSEQKNIDTLIRTIPMLPEDVSVIFVGKGDFKPYEKIATELGIEKRVYNVDHIENVELPKWYSWCDCFCTPSRWEGFGYVFIEAASCKTPIVTSNIRPMNEYLTNKENAILVNDYENPKALADGILAILDNLIDVNAIREEARKVGERFSKNLVDEQEIQIYESIIKKGPSRNRIQLSYFERKKLELKYWRY